MAWQRVCVMEPGAWRPAPGRGQRRGPTHRPPIRPGDGLAGAWPGLALANEAVVAVVVGRGAAPLLKGPRVAASRGVPRALLAGPEVGVTGRSDATLALRPGRGRPGHPVSHPGLLRPGQPKKVPATCRPLAEPPHFPGWTWGASRGPGSAGIGLCGRSRPRPSAGRMPQKVPEAVATPGEGAGGVLPAHHVQGRAADAALRGHPRPDAPNVAARCPCPPMALGGAVQGTKGQH